MKLYLPGGKCIYSIVSDDDIKQMNKGISDDNVVIEVIGPLEESVLKCLNKNNADLVTLFLCEYCAERGILTEEDLFQMEVKCNTYNNVFCDCISTVECIRSRCSFVWDSYLFTECTGMDWKMIQYFQQWRKITEKDLFLYWTFKLIEWGQYDNPFPYTLYKMLVTGKFEMFYNDYLEARRYFLIEEM